VKCIYILCEVTLALNLRLFHASVVSLLHTDKWKLIVAPRPLWTVAMENRKEALLCTRTFGGGTQLGQISFEAIDAESLATAPAARVGDDFVDAVVDRDGTGVGLELSPNECRMRAGAEAPGRAPPKA
jgi:hypothetical protein